MIQLNGTNPDIFGSYKTEWLKMEDWVVRYPLLIKFANMIIKLLCNFLLKNIYYPKCLLDSNFCSISYITEDKLLHVLNWNALLLIFIYKINSWIRVMYDGKSSKSVVVPLSTFYCWLLKSRNCFIYLMIASSSLDTLMLFSPKSKYNFEEKYFIDG